MKITLYTRSKTKKSMKEMGTSTITAEEVRDRHNSRKKASRILEYTHTPQGDSVTLHNTIQKQWDALSSLSFNIQSRY